MSICSTTSTIVSFRGEEMEVEQALDSLVKDVQSHLNDCQAALRNLAMSDDRGDSYCEAAEIAHDIAEGVGALQKLFKELTTMAKQVLGPCPKTDKPEYAALQAKWKQEKGEADAREKALRSAAAKSSAEGGAD